jgi:type IV pilus assembly protein PilA
MLRKRFDRDDEGFTLIELMVVVLIIAILLAIAIPTFLGARERANHRAAQSTLRNALAAEKVYFTDNQVFTSAKTDMDAIEPNLQWTQGLTIATAGLVYFDTDVTSKKLCMVVRSKSNDVNWSIFDANAGTQYGNTACTTAAAGGAAQKDGFPKAP